MPGDDRTLVNDDRPSTSARSSLEDGRAAPSEPGPAAARPREIGGPKGPEPTRYGDWERNGRCVDF
jgi:hypothetical protein